jgi:NADPH2:quinone reductase
MRAVILPEFGLAPVVAEIETPEPQAGEVRVKVHSASVNGFDVAVANGYLKGAMEHRFPVVLGKDFAGTIDELGDGVEGYAVGDRVFGVVTKAFLGDGSFGEYVTVPTSVGLSKLPDEIDFVTAAALGLAGTAAVDGFDAAGVRPGRVILVAGATGGVGNQVVQLAVKSGAHVIATAHSAEERTQVTGLGVSEIVDYTGDVGAQVIEGHPDGIDTVIHLAGDPADLLPLVKKGGTFVSTLLSSPDQLSADGVTIAAVMAHPKPETLDRLAKNQASGHTGVTVQNVYSLENASTALADFASGTLGKLVLSIA